MPGFVFWGKSQSNGLFSVNLIPLFFFFFWLKWNSKKIDWKLPWHLRRVELPAWYCYQEVYIWTWYENCGFQSGFRDKAQSWGWIRPTLLCFVIPAVSRKRELCLNPQNKQHTQASHESLVRSLMIKGAHCCWAAGTRVQTESSMCTSKYFATHMMHTFFL